MLGKHVCIRECAQDVLERSKFEEGGKKNFNKGQEVIMEGEDC